MSDKLREAAKRLGEKGAPSTEAERLLFEAWMSGHCWEVCGDWNGTTYQSPMESVSAFDPDAMRTRMMWAAWRDRAALAADAERVSVWQPIETAPRDGTAVLVMDDIWPGTQSGRAEDCNGHNTYVAEWWSNEGDGGEWVCYMDMIEDPTCPIEPTHWMPLPAPPALAAAEKEPRNEP